MSDQLNALIAQVVALAGAEGVDKFALLATFTGVLAGSVTVPCAGTFNADGITDPNANPQGLYRDSVLESFKSDLLRGGFTEAASYVKTWIASKVGAELITDPIIKVQVETDVSYSNNVTVNPGEQGQCFEYTVKPGKLGPDIQRVIGPNGLAVAVPDAMAAPQDCETLEDVRRFFKQRVANYLEANSGPPAPDVDFSPAIYKP